MTPKWVIAIAYRVMGDIDVDPCSSELANKNVCADHYGTKSRKVDMVGRVWLNPPYSGPGEHTDNVLSSIAIGVTTQAMVLVNSSTSTKWYQNLMQDRSAACLFKKRIAFVDPSTMKPKSGNRYDQTLFYFGPLVRLFREVMAKHGVVV